MNTSRSHIAAAILLTIGGTLTAAATLAIVAAGAVVRAGMAVRSSDASVLADLEALLPFIVAFVVIDLAAARGLLTGRAWAPVGASLLSLGVVAIGALGLLLLVLGNGPVAGAGAASTAAVDGIGIVASFTAIYLSILIALRLTALPSGRALAATA